MTFFDCVYMKVAKYYTKAEKKDDIDGWTGLLVLALMQSFNIFSLFLIFCIGLQLKLPLPSWSLLLLSVALLFANGTRYYRIDFSFFQVQWEEMAEKRKSMLNSLVPIYIVGSIVVCLILVIYVGEKKYFR
jgi:hypothetical protein